MGKIVVPASDNSIPATKSTHGKNVTIEVGGKLKRGSWNAQPWVSVPLKIQHGVDKFQYLCFRWGPLFTEQTEGVKKGTDFYLNKSKPNRISNA
jgi:hypothetical protein